MRAAPSAFAKMGILAMRTWRCAEIQAGHAVVLAATTWRAAIYIVLSWASAFRSLQRAAE
eukprot:7080688-Pyramimonas_sp.AAC.1